jgi:hypothetical protein
MRLHSNRPSQPQAIRHATRRRLRYAIALFISVCSSDATALSCIVPPLEERYRDSRHVALVEVTEARIEASKGFSRGAPPEAAGSIRIDVEAKRRDRQWRRVVTTVRVLEAYKSEAPPTRLMLTAWGQHPQVTVGARYLVFSNGPDVSQDCDGMPMVSFSDPAHAQMIGELRALAERGDR